MEREYKPFWLQRRGLGFGNVNQRYDPGRYSVAMDTLDLLEAPFTCSGPDHSCMESNTVLER